MKKIAFIISTVAALAVRCSGDLPLSDLANNTITLKLLGTYESNNPYGQLATLPQDDIIAAFTNAVPALNGTTLQTYAQNLAADPSKLRTYIDIAEIRIAEGQGKSSSQTIADYWSQFAISRQLMCSDYNTADNRTLSNCQGANGIERLTEFFNGGLTYPAVDVATGNYNHMGIYFRRFAMGPAAFFNGDGTYSDGTQLTVGNITTAESQLVATFDNRSIYGRDIETLLQKKYGEEPTEPMMFPLQRKDLLMRVTNGAEPYVLEVRVFIKNLMMVHIKQITGNASATTPVAENGAMVYVAPADWNIDHAFKNPANFDKHGGSVLMTGRVYQPAKVGSIQITGGTTPTGQYFAVTTSDKTLVPSEGILPLAATAASNRIITNLPPGTYNVYRTCDRYKCANTSTAGTCDAPVLGQDGYPETADPLLTNVTVTANTVTDVTNGTTSCP